MFDNSEKVSSFPSSQPASDSNIALALRLCRKAQILPDHEKIAIRASASAEGWSRNVCISIASPKETWVVKLPRVASHSSIAACADEGQRAYWMGECGIGPKVYLVDCESGAFVMSLIDGRTLSDDEIMPGLPDIMSLLHRLHGQIPPRWLGEFNIFEYVRKELKQALARLNLVKGDIDMLQEVLNRAEAIVGPVGRLALCHNDFWSTNILVDKLGKLWCIDFEYTAIGDPLWDVGYLSFNLETSPRNVALAYGLSSEPDILKVVAYCHTAEVFMAAWYANQGAEWKAYKNKLLEAARDASNKTIW